MGGQSAAIADVVINIVVLLVACEHGWLEGVVGAQEEQVDGFQELEGQSVEANNWPTQNACE